MAESSRASRPRASEHVSVCDDSDDGDLNNPAPLSRSAAEDSRQSILDLILTPVKFGADQRERVVVCVVSLASRQEMRSFVTSNINDLHLFLPDLPALTGSFRKR